ncbi:MFS general substrate transporter [Dendrothele bispora CBS 962.96]|uniref:MFS general substrate transporter n=1 Tax=Dendrothele bispora (strain CBS 962.96) TaxID=1314807 RepID=A0A4S8LMJ0_DENBC|nr:MFS general substrate transporter [Dendrothele bispora CBS 962.96]
MSIESIKKNDIQVEEVPVQQSKEGDITPTRRFDGGMRAWCTVAGAWLVQFCVMGLPMSFGATEAFYATVYLTGYTPSEINWIGSLQLCLMFILGFAVGKFFDAGYFHTIAITGSTIFLFGIFMLSLAQENQYYQIFLSQGLTMAIGSGIVYIPSSSVVSHHFKQRRALAMGFITTGSAVGGFVFSTMFNHFFDNKKIGFKWGIRICAFLCLVCLIAANLLMRTNYPLRRIDSKAPETSQKDLSSAPTKPKPGSLQFVLNLLRNPSYSLNIFIAFLIGLSSYAPVFSIQLFASSFPQNQHISPGLRTYLLALINLGSIVGRTVPGIIVDRLNSNTKLAICMTAAGVVALCMPLCTKAGSIVVFCVLYGIFQGSSTALFIPSVISLDKDMSTAGVRIGVTSVPLGIAFLVGTPIAGAVVQHRGSAEDPDWWAGAIYTGVSCGFIHFHWHGVCCSAILILYGTHRFYS